MTERLPQHVVSAALGGSILVAGYLLGGSPAHAEDIPPPVDGTETAPPDTTVNPPDNEVVPDDTDSASTEDTEETLTYQIGIGDTLPAIAARNGVTEAELAEANNISNPADVPIGAVITIPKPGIVPSSEVVAEAIPEVVETIGRQEPSVLPSLDLVDVLPAITLPNTGSAPSPTSVLPVIADSGIFMPDQISAGNNPDLLTPQIAVENSKDTLQVVAQGVVDKFVGATETVVDTGSNLVNILDPSSETDTSPETLASGLHTIVLPDKRVIRIQAGVTVRAESDGSLTITASGSSEPSPAVPITPSVEPIAPTEPVPHEIAPGSVSDPTPPEALVPSGNYKEYQASLSYPEVPANLAAVKDNTDGIDNQNEKVAARFEHYKEYNDWLFDAFTPTVEGYQAFLNDGISTEHQGIWGDKEPLDRNETIDPIGILTHWMAGRPEDVESFAAQMKHNVQFTVFPDGTVYLLTDQPNTYAWHATGASSNYIGAELWGFDEMDFTPQEMESWTYAIVYLMDQYGITPERNVEAIEATALDHYGDYTPTQDMIGNVIGHKESDKLLNKDPVGKIDPSSFAINSLYGKVLDLYNQVHGVVPPVTGQGDVGGVPDPGNTPGNSGSVSHEIGETKAFFGGDDIGGEVEVPDVIVPGPEPVTTNGETVANTSLGALHSDDFQYISLLKPESLEYTCDASVAVDKSKKGPIYAGDDATLFGEEAYGHLFEPYEIYLFHYNAAVEDGSNVGDADEYATAMSGYTQRESGRYSCLVGDLVPDKNGVLAYSYGNNQQRHDSDKEYRDPQANVDPIQSARNARILWKISGFKPWYSETYPVSDEMKQVVQGGREVALNLLQGNSV